MKKPLIFISNDDGIGSKGLRILTEVAQKFGRVVVIAPEVPQSGKSHAITMYSPLYLTCLEKSEDLEIYTCSGTPVDCVKMGYDHLFVDEVPTLNISGINHGSNSAISVLYSGTMGAAIEMSFYGSPAIGFSLTDHDRDADFDATVIFAEKIIGDILGAEIKEQLCLNVNVPAVRPEEIKGFKICRQTKGYWKEGFKINQDPRGRDYYWLTGDFWNAEPEAEDTDNWALENNYIAVVPVQVDMTNYQQLKSLHSIIK